MDTLFRSREQQESLAFITSLAIVATTLMTIVGTLLIA
jgi:hypothetical protein